MNMDNTFQENFQMLSSFHCHMMYLSVSIHLNDALKVQVSTGQSSLY